jgi:hypothetical protein
MIQSVINWNKARQIIKKKKKQRKLKVTLYKRGHYNLKLHNYKKYVLH